MKVSKKVTSLAAAVVVLFGAAFAIYSLLFVQINPNPAVWFNPGYYLQFIPLYISVTLLLGGIFIITNYSKVNFYLAIFGHATSEEIIFHLIGITQSPLPIYAMIIFLPVSLLALWMAYANTLGKKPVSVGEAIFGIVFSTAFILLPRFM